MKPRPSPLPLSLADALAKVTEPKKLPSAVVLKELPDLEGPPGIKEGLVRAAVAGAFDRRIGGELLGAIVQREITPESRDAFALALLQLWERKEFHGRLSWVLDAIGTLAGDRSTLLLANFMARWPESGDTGRKRTIAAIPTLVRERGDTAMLALIGLRQTAVVPSVLEAIIDGLEQAVDARHTTLSELFDAITPALGLDATGRRVFDYGKRRFVAAFDDHFEPRLRDEAGIGTDELPSADATAGDDLAHVASAREAWATLSVQLREAVKVQTFRLEQDMVSGRRWDAATWSRCLKDHPLLVSFTRRLVWGVYEDDDDGALIGAFRTAEDHSLVGRDDAEYILPPHTPTAACIGVAHPLHLGEAECAAWASHLADYEIIQPFAQLGRAVHHPTAAELADATATGRFASTRFKSGVLRDVLVRKGWERDPAFLREFYQRKFLHDGVVAIATMSPGVHAGAASYDVADQTIPTIEFRKKVGRGKSRDRLPLSEVPAVAFSEAVLDLGDVLAEQD